MAGTAVASPAGGTSVALPNLDSIIRGMLYVFILSFPFKGLLFIQRNGFIVLVVLLVLWGAVNRRHFFLRTPIDLPLLAFIGWVGFTVPFATFPAYSFKEFAKLLQHGLMFYTMVYFFREEIHRRRMVWMLLGLLTLVSAYGIWQFDTRPWFGQGVPEGREYYLIESFLSGDVALTTYLVMLTPLAAAVAWRFTQTDQRFLAAGAVVLAIICQFITFSRAGLLSTIGEAAAFAWGARQRTVTYMAAGVVLALVSGAMALMWFNAATSETLPFVPGAAKFTASNLEARYKIWTFGLTTLMDHPVVGIGFGKDNFHTVTQHQSKNLESTATTAIPAGTHNTFLDIAVGAGLPAIAGFLWLLWAIVRAGADQLRAKRNPLEDALSLALMTLVVGMIIRNFFDHMWVGGLAIQFWVLVGLTLRAYESR